MTEPNDTPIDASWEEMVEARNHPRSPHHALLMAVRVGEMTPKQAEEKCLADGLPLWHEGWQELHDITTNSVWWLPQAVLFYAWRDLAQTREQWERFSVWGHDLWRDPPDARQIDRLDEADVALRSDLSAGIVRAFGTDAGGKLRPIPCEAWDSLAFNYAREFTVVGADEMTAYSGVFVLRHEVVPLLIAEHPRPADTSATEPEMRRRLGDAPKRGRKPEPEVDRFWIEVHKATSSAKYGSQKLLTEHMVQWAGSGQCSYDPDTTRKKISALYRGMGWREGSAD